MSFHLLRQTMSLPFLTNWNHLCITKDSPSQLSNGGCFNSLHSIQNPQQTLHFSQFIHPPSGFLPSCWIFNFETKFRPFESQNSCSFCHKSWWKTCKQRPLCQYFRLIYLFRQTKVRFLCLNFSKYDQKNQFVFISNYISS